MAASMTATLSPSTFTVPPAPPADDASRVPLTSTAPPSTVMLLALTVPTFLTASLLLQDAFRVVDNNGPAISPDKSRRILFQCREPIKTKPKMVLMHGESGTGKTQYGRALESLGWVHLQTDATFHAWQRVHRAKLMSVSWTTDLIRGKLWDEMLKFRLDYIRKKLKTKPK